MTIWDWIRLTLTSIGAGSVLFVGILCSMAVAAAWQDWRERR